MPGRNTGAGRVTGARPGPGLLGRPCWALEAAGSPCSAARVIPTRSASSAMASVFLENSRRGGGVQEGVTGLGKGGVGTPPCPWLLPQPVCRDSLQVLGQVPYCDPQTTGSSGGLSVELSPAFHRDPSDQCCQPPLSRATRLPGHVHTCLLQRLVSPHPTGAGVAARRSGEHDTFWCHSS